MSAFDIVFKSAITRDLPIDTRPDEPPRNKELYTICNEIVSRFSHKEPQKPLDDVRYTNYLIRIISYAHKHARNEEIMATAHASSIAVFLAALPCFWHTTFSKKQAAVGSFLLGIFETIPDDTRIGNRAQMIESILGVHYFLLKVRTEYARTKIDTYEIDGILGDIYTAATHLLMQNNYKAMMGTSATQFSVLFCMMRVYNSWAKDINHARAVELYEFVLADSLNPIFKISL